MDWQSFCSEVCYNWFLHQEQIGGEGVEVEIDETQFVRRKYERGRLLNDIWLFGGIERVAKKRFVVALTGEIEEKRNKETLVPLVLKYIKPGSTIYNDAWGAYRGLGEINNYTHKVINHSKHFVDPEESTMHTQNIERLWRDIKEWSRRPGVRSKYMHQYLARYLFVTGTEEKNLLHSFLTQAALLYPPQGTKKHSEVEEDSDTELFEVAETE